MSNDKSRTQINQANAQHSTGPKTEAGKQRSSLNSLRHGLTGQRVVMPSEDLAAYQAHLESFTDEYNPKGATESQLVQSLADAAWRLNRIAALEANLLAAEVLDSKTLAVLSLHGQRLSRQFERTVTLLRDLQTPRRFKEENELEDYLDIVDMYEAKGEPYDPSADGFVFSEEEIDTAVRARNRRIETDAVFDFQEAA